MQDLVSLPPELLLDVFLFIPTLRDAVSLSTTCSRLRQVYGLSEAKIINTIVDRVVEWPVQARELYEAQVFCEACEAGPTTTLRAWESLTPTGTSLGDYQRSNNSNNSGTSDAVFRTRAVAQRMIENHRMINWTRDLFETVLPRLLILESTNTQLDFAYAWEEEAEAASNSEQLSGRKKEMNSGSQPPPPPPPSYTFSETEKLRFSRHFYRCLTIARYFNYRNDSAIEKAGAMLLEQFRTFDILCGSMLCRWLYLLESREEDMDSMREHVPIDDYKLGFYWLWSRLYGPQKVILAKADEETETETEAVKAQTGIGALGSVILEFVFFDRYYQASLRSFVWKDESLDYWRNAAIHLGYPVV